MGERGKEEEGGRKVSRGVAIGLGVALTVLLVCLVVVTGYYSSVLRNLQNQVTEYENQMESITSQLSNLLNQNVTSENLVEKVQNMMNALQNQIAQLESESETMQAQIQDLQEENSILENQNTRLQNEISIKNSQISQLESENENLQNQIVALQEQIDSLNSQILNLENQIQNLQNQIVELQNQIELKDSQISNLQNQVNELTKIINLEKYVVLVDYVTVNQPAGSYVYWEIPVDYAGYLVVIVHTSTTTNTYVRVIWSSYGVNYDETINVGSSGTAVFPVLPGTIEVRVGNTNLFSGATETVTITYHY